MKRSVIETFVGFIVLIGAIGFTFFSWSIVGMQNKGNFVFAEFSDIGGLKIGDDVKISGIKIGQVSSSSLDPETYMALVELNFQENILLPDDSIARISSSSLLGGNYIELLPGASETFLKSDDIIYNTRDSVSLTDLLGKAIFSATE